MGLHRNDKRRAAIWLLEQLIKPLKGTITASVDSGILTPINKKTYSNYKFADLIVQSKYSKEILREAADLLCDRQHIGIMENFNDLYDCTIWALAAGEIALNDDIYQEEINVYNSDKYYRLFRWVLPLAAITISILSIFISTCRKSQPQVHILPIQVQPKQPSSLRDTVIKGGKIEQTIEITDTNHASTGK
jgi:hypothetical protein